MKKRLGINAEIEAALDEIRPFLREDGGDVTLLEVTDDLVVRVRFEGACQTCQMNKMTFKSGVEAAVRQAVPAVIRVEAVA